MINLHVMHVLLGGNTAVIRRELALYHRGPKGRIIFFRRFDCVGGEDHNEAEDAGTEGGEQELFGRGQLALNLLLGALKQDELLQRDAQ